MYWIGKFNGERRVGRVYSTRSTKEFQKVKKSRGIYCILKIPQEEIEIDEIHVYSTGPQLVRVQKPGSWPPRD